MASGQGAAESRCGSSLGDGNLGSRGAPAGSEKEVKGGSGTSQTPRPKSYATHLFIRNKVREISQGRSLMVLDIGCGEGELMEILHRDGHRVYGYDLVRRREKALESVNRFLPDARERMRFTNDEQRIPFDSNMFDAVCSNQVLEHVKHLDCIIRESARVLKVRGVHIATFPYATYPIEGHILIPFAHWIPPGAFRTRYLTFFYFLRRKGRSSIERGRAVDLYLRNSTYYRFKNEFQTLSDTYFERYESAAGSLIEAKLELMRERSRIASLLARFIGLCSGPFLSSIVAYGYTEAALFMYPKKQGFGG